MSKKYRWRARVTDLINKIECANPPGDDPHKQLDAMHVFKYEILTALYRVYLSVPPKTADEMIQGFLRQVSMIVPPQEEERSGK